jgi:glycosyltransferase involved in cell wall biosynthesis
MTVSLIATVLNEGDSIHRLLNSIAAQTRQPDEIIFVDGGSRDETVAIIRSYANRLPVRVLVEPGCNISAGRNRAIAAANGEIVVATDAGVTLAPDWLQRITEPMLNDSSVQLVSGFFEADPQTVFEAAMGATVLPQRNEINPTTFLPSSRSVAFRKTAWESVGGYPEWLDYCEDLIFDLRLKKHYAPFAFVPDAVAHFRPRGSLTSYFKQYYQYARGDGKADLWRKRHTIRYLTYLVAIPLILLLGMRIHPLMWLLYVPAAAAYLYQPYRRLPIMLKRLTHVTPLDKLYAIALVPIIRAVGDVAKMIGYPVGWYWRLRHRPPDWQT